jgi:predicted branched-subunit amino acid permease
MTSATLTAPDAPAAASHTAAYAAGVRAMAGWLPGMALYGLVVGVTAGRADVAALPAWLLGATIYSGGAQVAALDLLGAGAAPLIVVVTILAVNARLVVYSAALGTHWRTASGRWRALAAYLLVDPSFAVGVDRYQRDGDGPPAAAHAHYLGGAAALWTTWLTASAVGVVAAGHLPAGLGLEFVMPLFLLGEAQRRLTTPAARRACAVAVVVAVLGTQVPLHLGLLVAIVAALAVGVAGVPGPSRTEGDR